MTESIETRVIEAIGRSQNFDPKQITLDTIFDDLGMSSLDALALVFDLEEEFKISISNDEAMGFRTVKQAIESVRKLVMASQPSPEEAGGELNL